MFIIFKCFIQIQRCWFDSHTTVAWTNPYFIEAEDCTTGQLSVWHDNTLLFHLPHLSHTNNHKAIFSVCFLESCVSKTFSHHLTVAACIAVMSAVICGCAAIEWVNLGTYHWRADVTWITSHLLRITVTIKGWCSINVIAQLVSGHRLLQQSPVSSW